MYFQQNSISQHRALNICDLDARSRGIFGTLERRRVVRLLFPKTSCTPSVQTLDFSALASGVPAFLKPLGFGKILPGCRPMSQSRYLLVRQIARDGEIIQEKASLY